MKKVVLKDIARHVGVSTALVSYVLNDLAEEKQVGKEIAEKIRQAAIELNYQPNQIARSLKTRKTHTIGLIVADINYRFSYGITRAIEEEAKKKNYTVIFGSSNEDHEKFSALVNVLVNRQVDGLILVPVENSENQIKALQKSEVPFVLIDRNFPGINANFIALDNHKASYDSTVHLIKTGHKRIAFVNYKTPLFHLHERNKGYINALQENNITFNPAWLQEVRDTHLKEDMQKAIDHIISLPEPCDAVFFATDVLAMTGLRHINQIKLNVPEQMAVLSFDEAEAFDLFYCPITHARQPLEKMGKLAVDIVVDLINHNKVLKQIYFESDFVVGRSCGEV